MGTIKDIADLTIDLINSTQDRKLTTKITAIQSLIATLQSEHSAIVEKNAQLVTINLNLEKKIFELEKEIFSLEKKQLKEMSRLKDKYVFDKDCGVQKSKETGHYFCTSCLLKNIESPLTENKEGWRCELNNCGKFYPNPSFSPPQPSKYCY